VISMAKARSRTAARKIKDKWKAKSWYNILAPPSFDNVTVADTLSDNPDRLINRVTEVSLQDLTNDFRKSHIKLFFKIYKVEESNALTQYTGHTLTSDYLRRMIRRKRSKIDGVYDVTTRDGAVVRVKPFATTDKRIQNSQRKIVRETMKKTISSQAKTNTLAEFIKNIIDGKVGSDVYKNCKKLYPVKRVEIHKTQVLSPPTIEIEEEKTIKTEESEVEGSDKKEKKTTKKPEEKPEPVDELPKEEKPTEEPEEEKSAEETEEPKEEKPEPVDELPKEEKPTEEPEEEKPTEGLAEPKEKKSDLVEEPPEEEPPEEPEQEEPKEEKSAEETEEPKEEKPEPVDELPKEEKPTEEPEQEEEPAKDDAKEQEEPKEEKPAEEPEQEEPKEEKSAEDAEETKKEPKKTE